MTLESPDKLIVDMKEAAAALVALPDGHRLSLAVLQGVELINTLNLALETVTKFTERAVLAHARRAHPDDAAPTFSFLNLLEGPAREVDLRIHWLVTGESDNWETMELLDPNDWEDEADAARAPHYTSDLNVIVGLIKETFPGCMWSCSDMEEGPYAQILRVVDGGYIGGHAGGYAATVPLALVATFLRACGAAAAADRGADG